MANQYGLFWNSVSGDRTYDADSFAEWAKKFFTSGVFNGDLQVTAGSGMTVNVGTGYANIEGKVRFFDVTTAFTISPASGSYPRIDTIVVQSDTENRIISLQYVEGEYSGLNPAPTAPVRSGGIYELVLAQIAVGAGVTQIEAGDITDKRADDAVCGWVTGTVDSVNVSQLTAQAQAQFDEWFQEMKDQLSEDAAGNLQLQIDALSALNDSLIVQFSSAGWTTTETVNGTTYYTQTVSVTSVSSDHPEVGIVPISGTLPTNAEQDAFDSVEYFTANDTTNTIKAYATSAPGDTFAVVVKGAS